MIWASVNRLFFIRISSFSEPRKFYVPIPLFPGGITYGFKARQKHYLEEIHASLVSSGIIISPDIRDIGRDDWVRLSVSDPNLPVGDFVAASIAIESDVLAAGTDPWLIGIADKHFASEKEVEIRFVIPLLERLGYSEDDRADGYPVDQVVGVRKIRTEADFVLFDGRNRSKDSALLVVEAKNIGKNLSDHIQQARSYAMFLGTPYYLVTNADEIRVYLYRSPIESDIEVYRASRRDIQSTFSALFNLIGRPAIIEYKKRRVTVG
jgi:hypothetical protein